MVAARRLGVVVVVEEEREGERGGGTRGFSAARELKRKREHKPPMVGDGRF